MARKPKVDHWTYAERIAALDIPDGENFAETAAKIIDVFRGAGDYFMMFDDRYRDMNPASGGRFALVRMVRNSHIYGPLLFAALNERPKKA